MFKGGDDKMEHSTRIQFNTIQFQMGDMKNGTY